MHFPFAHPGFQRQQLAIELPHPFANARLVVNGEPAPTGTEKRTYRVRRDDGTEVIATLKPSATFVDPVPRVLMEGTLHEVAFKLPWYKLVACWLPIVLVVTGGAIGGAAGGAAVGVNARVFRAGWPPLVTWGVVLATMLAAFVLYLILAGLLHLVMG